MDLFLFTYVRDYRMALGVGEVTSLVARVWVIFGLVSGI